MIGVPFRIAVAGTHSTGKTTFLKKLQSEFKALGHKVAYVHDSAVHARDVGFPILADHTFESTAWLMARAIELETAASLSSDVILVDRPVLDALGYLCAALLHTGRSIPAERMSALEKICEAWVNEYDLLFLTVLDKSVPLGEGRDSDLVFRERAASEVGRVIERFVPCRHLLTNNGAEGAVDFALASFEKSQWIHR